MKLASISILAILLLMFFIELLRGTISSKFKLSALDNHSKKVKLLRTILVAIGIAASAFLSISVVIGPRTQATSSTHYHIDKGKQNFKPNESLFPVLGVKGFVINGHIDSSSWISQKDWAIDSINYDRDWHDWNKLKGYTRYLTANNHTSAQGVFKSDTIPYTFHIAGYTNYPKTKWQQGELISLRACQSYTIECKISRVGFATYYVTINDSTTVSTHNFRKRGLGIAREIGTWIGGANNEPGPYGGKASQPMDLYLSFHPTKK